MAYRLLDHTADLAVEVSAPTIEDLFVESLRALTDCLTPLAAVRASESRTVEITAPDLERLLIGWLGEIIFLHEADGLVFSAAEVELRQRGSDWTLRADLGGELFDPERHQLKTLIKAATYHDTAIEQRSGGWQARVVLDI